MKRILIVDDSAFMRGILKDLLMSQSGENTLSENIELFEADGKANALKQLKEVKPDLILLDIVMRESETEGVEFIKEIKDFFNVSKVIMISSIGQTAILDECKKMGIQCYLQKPFEHDQVIAEVNKGLAMKGAY